MCVWSKWFSTGALLLLFPAWGVPVSKTGGRRFRLLRSNRDYERFDYQITKDSKESFSGFLKFENLEIYCIVLVNESSDSC